MRAPGFEPRWSQTAPPIAASKVEVRSLICVVRWGNGTTRRGGCRSVVCSFCGQTADQVPHMIAGECAGPL